MENLPHQAARQRQLGGSNRILEVEDQRIRTARSSLQLLALAVPGYEEQRPELRGHSFGLFIISAARLQEATSSFR